MVILRKGKVYFKNTLAGYIEETEEGYRFYYDQSYLPDTMKRDLVNLFDKRLELFI